jgi:hypothetical protein
VWGQRPGPIAIGEEQERGWQSEKPDLTEVCVRKFSYLFMGLLLAGAFSLAASAKDVKTFVGSISDSMCGATHMMPGKSDKDCTLECVKGGAKYILVDPSGKIYQLSDQKKPEQFAGAKVKVTGALNGDTITVTSITAAN